jgi:hypothetical protein
MTEATDAVAATSAHAVATPLDWSTAVNWPMLIYVGFSVAVIVILSRYANINPVELALNLVREIIGLVTSGKITRTGIDGGITIGLFALAAITLVVAVMRDLPEALGLFGHGPERPTELLMLIVFFVVFIAVTGIISLVVTGPPKR